jgi:anti-sigma B factor antagonist
MKIETRKIYDVLVVDMAGKLDTSTSGDASDQMVKIAQGDNKQVVLNLDGLEYVSSAGLRVILLASKLLQAGRGELKICHARDIVKKVLETSGFNSLLKIYDTEKDAVAAFPAL